MAKTAGRTKMMIHLEAAKCNAEELLNDRRNVIIQRAVTEIDY